MHLGASRNHRASRLAQSVGDVRRHSRSLGFLCGKAWRSAMSIGLKSEGSKQCGNKQCGKDYANFVLPREDLPPKNPRMLPKTTKNN